MVLVVPLLFVENGSDVRRVHVEGDHLKMGVHSETSLEESIFSVLSKAIQQARCVDP